MALVLCAAGVPLLPTNEMKVAGTLMSGCVLLVGAGVTLRAGEPLRWTALDAPVLAFLAIAVVSTAFGVNPRLSALPNRTRGEGLLDYFIYLPMALAAARLSQPEVQEILAVLLGAGGLIGAVAIGQYYGLDVTPWIGSRGLYYGLRSWGTLANPDFMGGYAALVLPIGIAMAAGAVTQRRWWGYAAAATLLYGALLGSQARSAWLATAVAGAILLWRPAWTTQGRRRLAMLGLAFAAVTIVMTITQPSVALGERAGTALSLSRDSSLRGVFWIWQHIIPMIGQRPVFGWGFSAVPAHLPGLGTPGYYRVFGHSPVFIDVAHNDFLQVAVNMGLLGLAAYVWIWSTTLVNLHEAARGTSSPVRAEAAGILAGLSAYFVVMLYLWSHIGDTNVFWVLAGTAVSVRSAASTIDAGPAIAATG
jgi:O-antigen ligase